MYNIKKGDKLEIKLGSTTCNGLVNEYNSEDGFVVVNIIDPYDGAPAVSKQCKVSLMLDGGVMNFDADLIEKHHIDTIKLKITSEGEKVQRREFLRCECSLPMRFALIDDVTASVSETQNQQPKALSEGTVKDIGGGGMRFVTNTEIENGDNIKFLLLLEGEYLIIVGKILHKYKTSLSLAKFQYRVVFIDILPEDREKIVQFVLREHQKQGVLAES